MQIIKADTLLQIQAIEQLAREILPEHYGDYLPMEHVLFFIEKYQTEQAIADQIRGGFEYYILSEHMQNIGYIGIQQHDKILLLSKLYVLNRFRGKSFGARAMEFIDSRASVLNVSEIELLVHSLNEKAIEFYKANGFAIAENIMKEYENGFTMKEYRMTKRVV